MTNNVITLIIVGRLNGARYSSQCRQDRRSDRHDDLHKKLCRLFLTHIILLSLLPFYLFTFYLILGTVSLRDCPQVEINRRADRLQDRSVSG